MLPIAVGVRKGELITNCATVKNDQRAAQLISKSKKFFSVDDDSCLRSVMVVIQENVEVSSCYSVGVWAVRLKSCILFPLCITDVRPWFLFPFFIGLEPVPALPMLKWPISKWAAHSVHI